MKNTSGKKGSECRALLFASLKRKSWRKMDTEGRGREAEQKQNDFRKKKV